MVDWNELGNDGVAAVAAGAAHCRALQTLHLNGNNVERAGGLALLHHFIPSLHVLHLTDNPNLPASIITQLQDLYPTVTI
jgi:Leucine Rich repeat